MSPVSDAELLAFMEAIVGDPPTATRLLGASPALATAKLVVSGATRAVTRDFFFDEIRHYVYAGDGALHVAAAAYRLELARALLACGAAVDAKNRRGATPLHYAVDGGPRAAHWNPRAQAKLIDCLLAAGADPNSVDKSGTMPLHRAVRNRCAAAVRALVDGGADARAGNQRGSTPLSLARQTTGRGGSGSLEAKAEQAEILRILGEHGAR